MAGGKCGGREEPQSSSDVAVFVHSSAARGAWHVVASRTHHASLEADLSTRVRGSPHTAEAAVD